MEKIETLEAVEAALMPELLFSVSEKSLKDDDAQKVLDALKRDVELYKGVLPKDKRGTFDRYLDKTCNEILMSLYDKKKDGWDAISCYSAFVELCSRLAEEGKLKVTEDLAFAVRTITQLMEEQHGSTWNGMLKAAGKRSGKILTIMHRRKYFV